MKCLLNHYIHLALLLLLGSLSTQLMATTDAASSVSVNEPYVRAVPPGQPNSAAFMQLYNSSTAQHSIVKAKSTVSGIVELHTHVKEDGMMKMRQVKQIDIPPQSKTTLQPGGLHVMFIGLKSELKPGSKVTFTLIFEDGSKKTIEAPVRKMKMHMKKPMH